MSQLFVTIIISSISLMADAVLDGRIIHPHLRVAWQKKNEVIIYDPTDERWSCIAIDRDIGTWRILPGGSLTNYPISELCNPNSKLAEQPVVFTRYGQVPQVIPDRNYQLNIMQQFIEKCTNIKDPKDQLLFKTYLIGLFIPDIIHPILLLRGVKGVAKSILQRMVKQIIDPAQAELLILSNKREDFIINWARNYYIPYDNVIKISRRLSSDLCAASTGAAFSKRTYYTTADETYLEFRRCFSLSSIGPSLTEDDALQRSITIKLPKIEKQNRKTEEKILEEFDNMLPQLLGYIFDTVAKTMQIKDQLDKTSELDGELERMADFIHLNFIKNSVYPFMYRDLQLDTVATGMLEGYGKYTSESTGIKITGENVLQFPIEEQKKYVLRDAELVIKLIERNNYEILNILRCVADIAGLDFKQVCHAGVGKAWESIIYQAIQIGECERPLTVGLKKRRYSGALVLKPEPKSYTTPIEIFDVKGLYPTVMILHNLSFETVCCKCCKDKPEAKVPQQIMDIINDGLRDKIKSATLYEAEKRKVVYWICTMNKGLIPNTLLKFKEQREYYRSKGNEPMSQALKVMMNSIYGLFGSEGIFEFQDYRVAELVTAFAREKLLEMKELANRSGMNIIYGDTDSIFVSVTGGNQQQSVDAFIVSCKHSLKVNVDHQNTFIKSILIGKKHYIGIQPDGKIIVKGMEGKKRDRPAFFRQVFGQLIEGYKNNIKDVSINILKAFKQLESAEVDPSLLAYSVILNKDPNDYRSYMPQYKIGTSLKKEAGEIIRYYKTGQQEDGYKDYSSNYQDLNIDVYRLELWNVVKEILRLLGDIHSIEKQIFPNDEELENDCIPPRNGETVIRRKFTKNVRLNENQQVNESLSKYQVSMLITKCINF